MINDVGQILPLPVMTRPKRAHPPRLGLSYCGIVRMRVATANFLGFGTPETDSLARSPRPAGRPG
jgi:hypothetical protein